MARVELYRESFPPGVPYRLGKWRWRFVSNGHIMADSGQGYSRRIDCLAGAATVLGGFIDAPGCHVCRYTPDGRGENLLRLIPVRDLTRKAPR